MLFYVNFISVILKNRPVLVFKYNLPYDDFIAIPISSKIDVWKFHNQKLYKMYEDELLIQNRDFSEGNIPKVSKLMIRKTFVVSKQSVLKKYGTLDKKSYEIYLNAFCKYFGCENKKDRE